MNPAEQVKYAISVFDVLERLGANFKRAKGQTQMVFCLNHDDGNSPAMKVYADSNSAFCHACEKGGDVVDLVRWTRKITQAQAIQWLVEEFDLTLDQVEAERARFQRARTRVMQEKRQPELVPQAYLELMQRSYNRLLRQPRKSVSKLEGLYRQAMAAFKPSEAERWYQEWMIKLEAA